MQYLPLHTDILAILSGYAADITIYRCATILDINRIDRYVRIYIMLDMDISKIFLGNNGDNYKYFLACYNLRDKNNGNIYIDFKNYNESDNISTKYYCRYYRGKIINSRYVDEYFDQIIYRNRDNKIEANINNKPILFRNKYIIYDIGDSSIKYNLLGFIYDIYFETNDIIIIAEYNKITKLQIICNMHSFKLECYDIPVIAGIIYYIGTDIPLFDMNKGIIYRLCGAELFNKNRN